jgi:hypothetical protein
MVKYCILDGSLSIRYAFIRYCKFVTEEGQANQIEIKEIKYISSIIYSKDLSLVSSIKTQNFILNVEFSLKDKLIATSEL